MKKLEEELNEEMYVNAMIFSIPKSKKIFALLKTSSEEEKTILMVSPEDDDYAKKISEILLKIKEK